jgi:hypothetical protein
MICAHYSKGLFTYYGDGDDLYIHIFARCMARFHVIEMSVTCKLKYAEDIDCL